MKITLLEIQSKRPECINKDFMAGYGWAFNAGKTFRARLINFVKKYGEKLPLLSFGYLASIFSKNGHLVEVKSNRVPESDLVIIHSSMVDYSYELEWAAKIKSRGIKVGFIGPFSSYKPDLFIDSCNFIIKGEPEQLAMHISDSWLPEGIVESKPIDNLDILPFPKWELFPIKNYSYLPALKEKPFLSILASRGCTFQCNYCPYRYFYKYRSRSAEKVYEEICYLIKHFKIKGFIFRDPLFGLDRKFVTTLCEKMIKNNLKLKWVCETRPDLLDISLLDTMFRAGLRVINVGIESSSDDVLQKASRRPIIKNHQEKIIDYCDKLGIRVTAFYMIGLPDDNDDSIKATIRYAQKLNTHVAQFFVHTPFPGTTYFRQIKDEIIDDNWQHFDCYTPVLRHKYLSKEQILALKEKAFLSYYYRPQYLFKFCKRFFRDFLN